MVAKLISITNELRQPLAFRGYLCNMRRGMALLLLFVLCHQLVLKLGVVAWYQVNKDYIAKNLCENRNKPELNCCGKCYLRKQLKKVDGHENPVKNAVLSIEKMDALACILPPTINYDYSHPELKTSSIKTPVLQDLYQHPVSFSIFHPPSVAA